MAAATGGLAVLLWVLAALAFLWVMVPVAMYFLGRWWVRLEVSDDPDRIAARLKDGNYRRNCDQFRALGYRPVATFRESGWFFTPITWLKRFPVGLYMSSPDERTVVSIHRVFPFERVRWAASSLNDAGGIMKTVAPMSDGLPPVIADGADRRVQIARKSAEIFLTRHREQVEELRQARGLNVETATAKEVGARERAFDERQLRANKSLRALALFPLMMIFMAGMPIAMIVSAHRFRPMAIPLMLLMGAATFTLMRWVVMPLSRGIQTVGDWLGLTSDD